MADMESPLSPLSVWGQPPDMGLRSPHGPSLTCPTHLAGPPPRCWGWRRVGWNSAWGYRQIKVMS